MKPPILILVKALEWYEERLKIMNEHNRAPIYLDAVATELLLDGGKRARNAIDNVKDLE